MAAYRGVPVTVLVGLCLLEPSGSLILQYRSMVAISQESKKDVSEREQRLRKEKRKGAQGLFIWPLASS